MSDIQYPNYEDHDVRRIYDYIDVDGDLLAFDIVDDAFIAASILHHGRDAALCVLFNEPEEARKIAAQLLAWADRMEAA